MSEKAKTSKKSRKHWLIENVVSLGLALLLVLGIRSSFVEAYKIPSGSMIPTLLVGDHIFVNKFAYGFKVPFLEWFLDEPVYLIKAAPPKRGDIIVFIYPKDESLYYIKRIVGLPGDTIEIRDKTVYINGHPLVRETITASEQAKALSGLDEDKYNSSNLTVYGERIGERRATVMLDAAQFYRESHGPIQIPKEQYFVMGDNRDHSNDSRFWGFVPANNIKGRAFVIWLSLWMSFSEKQFSFRPGRIGTILN